MHTEYLTIIGCGGHAKVVLDALALSPHKFCLTLCDDSPELVGQLIGEYVVKKLGDSLETIDGFAHISVGNNHVRQSISKRLSSSCSLFTIIHPAAVCAASAQVAEGVFIAAKAILAPESVIGEGCIINHAAIIDHDVKVGAYSHIAPNSTLGGNVLIGNRVLVGSGATVLPGITIGDNAIIGAGAVVSKNVPANITVKGIPAR